MIAHLPPLSLSLVARLAAGAAVLERNKAMTNLTAMVIATNDSVRATFGGPDGKGFYLGFITLGPEENYRILLYTKAIYRSTDAAIHDMRHLIEETKRTFDPSSLAQAIPPAGGRRVDEAPEPGLDYQIRALGED